MCGCSSKCKDKKCKKNCTILTYYYDAANQSVSKPVPDVYPAVGGAQTFSVFVHGNIYYDKTFILKFGTVEVTSKVLQNSTLNPPLIPQVVSNVTVFLPDGKTSLSFQYFYANNLPTTPPGIYKSICYSSTGLYYGKTCYVTGTVPQEGSVWTFELKVCDRK